MQQKHELAAVSLADLGAWRPAPGARDMSRVQNAARNQRRSACSGRDFGYVPRVEFLWFGCLTQRSRSCLRRSGSALFENLI